MRRSRRTPGISRIDQPEKRTHGFFVRVQRQGKTHSAFFTDQRYGGKKRALAKAQAHYRKLVAKLGPVVRRHKDGLRKMAMKQHGEIRWFWVATWHPKPTVMRRKAFSIWKFGSQRAREMARRALKAGSKK